MNARTIRRAIERKQAREAKKQALKQTPAPVTAADDYITAERERLSAEYETTKATLEQLQANRRNAQSRTGEGKSVSSKNALKTGLTGRTVLLPGDDAALYENHVGSFFTELKPVGGREIELTRSIADSKWRLARIPSLEFGIYALGRIEFAEDFAAKPPAEAAALIEAKTFLAYQRQLNNLSIQESRLRRQCEKDIAELQRLQQLRAQTERAEAKTAAVPATRPFVPGEIGFVFSNPRMHALNNNHDLHPDQLTRPQAA